jgi:trehalose 6-phosphate phosphatase
MAATTAHLTASQRALFLDVDGTLLEIAPTPDGVGVPASLKTLLRALYEAHQGALALISGRSIGQLDELFAPLRLPAAGLHGLQLRHAAGAAVQSAGPSMPTGLWEQTCRALADFTARHAGTLLEDKGGTLALHYRQAPGHEAAARAAAAGALALLGGQWQLLEGKCVLELKPREASKARAIEALMRLPPFAGRVPVFAGDDVTDETGFGYVNARGGDSIHVGNAAPTRARRRLADVAAVHRWLRELREDTA